MVKVHKMSAIKNKSISLFKIAVYFQIYFWGNCIKFCSPHSSVSKPNVFYTSFFNKFELQVEKTQMWLISYSTIISEFP